MLSCEATGKNIEQAIENALFELKASREDVDIKILSEGGFLKKAKVLVTISDDAREKYEKKQKLRSAEIEEKADEDFAEDFMKKKVESTSKEEKKAEKEVAKTEKKEDKAEEKAAKKEEKTESKAKKEMPQKIFADDEISKNDDTEEKNQRERKLTGQEFLEGVLKALDLDGNIEKTTQERHEFFSLTGENLNDLIGHHGECMFALSTIMNNVCKTENHKRIILDVEGYRKKREESLSALAKRIASKVAKSGRYYKLEPMDASERKIIHTALQDDDRVTTLSKGEEPRRYLIVFPKEYSNRD